MTQKLIDLSPYELTTVQQMRRLLRPKPVRVPWPRRLLALLALAFPRRRSAA